jgi:tetratricopeptide (TPR) repeat protein
LSREKGDYATSRSRVDQALKLIPDYPPALYQKVLIAIATNHPADGDAALKQLIAANPDGVRLDELKGRMAFLEGRAEECVLDFRTALSKNSQDLHAALLGAGLASAAGKSDASYELMSKALDVDPAFDSHHRGLTDYYESTKSELLATTGGFEKEDRVLAQPMVYAGILHYFRGDVSGAERFFNDALRIEPGSASALSFLAQISLDRKKYPKAEELASKGLESERLSILAKFLLAEADDAQGKVEDARRLYGEIIVQGQDRRRRRAAAQAPLRRSG